VRAPAAIALAIAVVVAGCGAGGSGGPEASSTPATTRLAPATIAVPPAASEPQVGYPVARIVRPTVLRSAPAGRRVARIGAKTEWGTTRYLPVVRRRGGWLGVVATEQPNGRLAWVREADTRDAVTRSRIVVDLSARRLRLLSEDGRTLMRVPVGIGAPATPTPVGRFAITDGLRPAAGSPYGCCILALSGHQPHVPQGWTGGDRLAIHGTSAPATIGAAASHGCLRAGDADLRRLMRRVGLGTVVEIRP
jgi:lipoprotein-anchoring transpeptidase ErfK/SrfK